MSLPIGPMDTSSSSSPINNAANQNSNYIFQGYEISQETIDRLGLNTDSEINSMNRDELVDALKRKQIKVIIQDKENKKNVEEKETLIQQTNTALAQSTSAMAAGNIAVVQQIRADTAGITQGTKILTVGRVISMVCSIGIFILTAICILL
jgi:hypothetical protein